MGYWVIAGLAYLKTGLRHWNTGTLGHWKLKKMNIEAAVGTLGFWDWEIGRLRHWDIGRLESWEPGTLGDWDVGALGHFDIGIL